MTRAAKILVNNVLAGILNESLEGEFIFIYDQNYLTDEDNKPISLTLPKRSEPFVAVSLFPFFDGLIPEGWLMEIGAKNWKLKSNDRMGLLLHLCADCIGNVSVLYEN